MIIKSKIWKFSNLALCMRLQSAMKNCVGDTFLRTELNWLIIQLLTYLGVADSWGICTVHSFLILFIHRVNDTYLLTIMQWLFNPYEYTILLFWTRTAKINVHQVQSTVLCCYYWIDLNPTLKRLLTIFQPFCLTVCNNCQRNCTTWYSEWPFKGSLVIGRETRMASLELVWFPSHLSYCKWQICFNSYASLDDDDNEDNNAVWRRCPCNYSISQNSLMVAFVLISSFLWLVQIWDISILYKKKLICLLVGEKLHLL